MMLLRNRKAIKVFLKYIKEGWSGLVCVSHALQENHHSLVGGGWGLGSQAATGSSSVCDVSSRRVSFFFEREAHVERRSAADAPLVCCCKWNEGSCCERTKLRFWSSYRPLQHGLVKLLPFGVVVLAWTRQTNFSSWKKLCNRAFLQKTQHDGDEKKKRSERSMYTPTSSCSC